MSSIDIATEIWSFLVMMERMLEGRIPNVMTIK